MVEQWQKIFIPNLIPGATKEVSREQVLVSLLGPGAKPFDLNRPADSKEVQPYQKSDYHLEPGDRYFMTDTEAKKLLTLTSITGLGSEGLVLTATDSETGQRVSVKFLYPGRVSIASYGQEIAPFYEQAKVWQCLNHPNIPKLLALSVLPIIEENRTRIVPCAVMEHIDGDDLAVRHQQELFHPKTVLSIAMQMAEALDYCHQTAGVIHRDVKLENIMIDKDDRVYLIDWSAAVLSSSIGKGRKFPPKQSWQYPPPELFHANPDLTINAQAVGMTVDRIDGRYDQHCLAVAIYKLLTHSETIFTDDNGQEADEIKHYHPTQQLVKDQQLSPAIYEVLATATNYDPGRRYPNCQVFAEALQQVAITDLEF